jgi:hypothetical protein
VEEVARVQEKLLAQQRLKLQRMVYWLKYLHGGML